MNSKTIVFLTILALSLMAGNGTFVAQAGPDRVARVVWEYRENPDFYSYWEGDADRMPNGNTLISDCVNGRILEVTREGEKVWELFFEDSVMYRSERVPDLDLSGSPLYNSSGYDMRGNVTVTVWNSEKACNGITFAPAWGYLWGINMTGHAVWRYRGYWREQKMLPNNHLLLLLCAREARYVREIDLDGNLIFDFSLEHMHHDVIKPTSDTIMYLHRVFLIVNSSRVLPFDEIQQVNLTTGNIIWTWNIFNYLPHSQYCPICVRGGRDWTHANSITFQVENGRKVVYLDVRNLNQIVKIDYESKEIIWTLGENGDFKMFEKDGIEVAKLFSHQHDPEILPNGNILLFDNGFHRDFDVTKTGYSRAIEIELIS